MAALHGTLALTQVDAVAVLIGQHLDLDVPRPLDQLFEINLIGAEGALRLALRAPSKAAFNLRGEVTARIPLPPPPAAAFSITG